MAVPITPKHRVVLLDEILLFIFLSIGKIERFNGTFKKYLEALVKDLHGDDWEAIVPKVCPSLYVSHFMSFKAVEIYNTTYHKSTGMSPWQAEFGYIKQRTEDPTLRK